MEPVTVAIRKEDITGDAARGPGWKCPKCGRIEGVLE
jgi:hypothetical protein